MYKALIFLILIVIVAVVVIPLINRPSQKEEKKDRYKYKRKDFLMSRPEHEFFDILVAVLGNEYYVFPQIHLSTIIDNKVVGQNWKGAFNHVNQKSVDFVVCDKNNIKPLLAIELDDKSHEKEDRKERDRDVEEILRDSDMPLVRFENHGSFDKEEIKRVVMEKLKIS